VDLVRVVVLAILGFAILSGHASIALLYISLVIIATGEVLMRSASSAMLPMVVPKARLERANGWLTGGATLTRDMISGPAGGALFLASASLPFLSNAVTYMASALFVTLIAGSFRSAPADGAQEAPRRIRHDVVVGLKWLMQQRLL